MLSMVGAVLSFGLIFWLAKKRFNLGVAVILGSVVLGTLSMSVVDLFLAIWGGLIDPLTWELTIIVALIALLGHCLQRTGEIEALTDSLKTFLADSRLVLALVPAVFGMLPMPGGALISAPMVESEGNRLRLNATEKTFLNLWFRHVMFFVFPLQTMLILAARLADVNIYELVAVQVPLFFFAIFLGWSSLRKVEYQREKQKIGKAVIKKFVKSFLPILVVILLNLVFGVNFAVSLCVGVLTVFLLNELGLQQVATMIIDGLSWRLMFDIVGIMIFQHVTLASGVLNTMVLVFQEWGTPVIFLSVIIPFFFALMLGGLGAIAITFPMLLPMIKTSYVGSLLMVSTLYVSSFLGYLISPMHLCLTLSCEYFKSDMVATYRKLISPVFAIIVVSFSLAYFSLM